VGRRLRGQRDIIICGKASQYALRHLQRQNVSAVRAPIIIISADVFLEALRRLGRRSCSIALLSIVMVTTITVPYSVQRPLARLC
jgi:hypothetical protein